MSFREAIEVAEAQIGMAEITRRDAIWSVMHDICRVMAEIYMAPPSMLMKVSGEELEAGMISEVFREITPDCAMVLAHRLTQELGGVRFIKAYLRSALYNAVFEYEASVTREVKEMMTDWGC